MFGHRVKIILLISTLHFSCATTTAPGGWLPTSEHCATDLFGGWVSVEYKDGTAFLRADGELIAVEKDRIFVFAQNRKLVEKQTPFDTPAKSLDEKREAHSELIEIPTQAVLHANLRCYDPESGKLGLWTIAGTVSTISHGFVLLLSAPIWILGGSLAAASHARSSELVFPDKRWDELSIYARFPQGLPPELDQSLLRPKPYFPK